MEATTRRRNQSCSLARIVYNSQCITPAPYWTHAARLKADGKWTSKLGTEEDIEHNTLESMEGDLYGLVIQILRKKTLLLPLHNYS